MIHYTPIFICDGFELSRGPLRCATNTDSINPENFRETMIRTPETWKAVTEFIMLVAKGIGDLVVAEFFL